MHTAMPAPRDMGLVTRALRSSCRSHLSLARLRQCRLGRWMTSRTPTPAAGATASCGPAAELVMESLDIASPRVSKRGPGAGNNNQLRAVELQLLLRSQHNSNQGWWC